MGHATDAIRERWVRAIWIIELVSSGRRSRKPFHRYSQHNGVQMLSLLRTFALNLLRFKGFRSIHAGLMAVAHDIGGILSWAGVSPAESGCIDFQSTLSDDGTSRALVTI